MFAASSGVDAPEHSRWRPFFMKRFLPNVVANGRELWSTHRQGPHRPLINGEADLVSESLCTSILFIAANWGLGTRDEEPTQVTQALLCVSIDPPHAEEPGELGDYYRARHRGCRGKRGR